MTVPGGRRVVAQQWMSVDGFASGPTDEAEIFAHVSEASNEAGERLNAALLPEVGSVLLGRRSYESFVGFWPTDQARGQPMAPYVNALPKVVASTTLTSAPWGEHAAATVVSPIGPVLPRVTRPVVVGGGAHRSPRGVGDGRGQPVGLAAARVWVGVR